METGDRRRQFVNKVFACKFLIVNMVFSQEDRILIKNLVLLRGYSSRRLLKEFPQKVWNKNGLDVLLRKIRSTGTVDRQPGSGRPCTVRTPENIDAVHDLILSQEDAPQTHRTTRQIARETAITTKKRNADPEPTANSPYLQPFSYGIGGSLKTWLHRAVFR